ncbi:glycosyltransferase [Galbitalea sp. SE-J8]|uniref:glycosyltransferase n=1 Tax=Galbitalea sp. SE-J8 TaxID=3054952 RepID=UPI00259C81E4|nr:glycosyltransferase [Galbitalea sp. SE-J8]MDM4762954.1 glycosyltransferase [Galbitalea sp. SE-J8]
MIGAPLYDEDFDPGEYRLRYADLNGWSDAGLALHWIDSGRAEGRVGRLSDEERAALVPSRFIASEYRARYPELPVADDAQAVEHFLAYGRAEGRRGRLQATQLDYPTTHRRGDRPSVLLVVHEATRTGVPILTWNVARSLSATHDVVVLLMSRGVLVDAFRELAADVVVLADGMPDLPGEVRAAVERIRRVYEPAVAIGMSAVVFAVAEAILDAGIPLVQCFHEAPPPPHSPRAVIDAVGRVAREADAIVFSAELVRSRYVEAYGEDILARAALLRQGATERPGGEPLAATAPEVPDGPIVLGVGSVTARKGPEFFVQAAAYARTRGIAADARFVWLGARDPGTPVEFELALRDQIAASGLAGAVELAGEVPDVDAYYRAASAVLLTSRFDPLPNAALDAFAADVPVVCFAGASGVAEILAADPDTRGLVVPYLDTDAAARLLVELLDDPDAARAAGRAGHRVLERDCLAVDDYAAALLALEADARVGLPRM